MAALNFPDSPSNGDEFSGYVYDSAKGVWNRLPTLPALDLVNFSAVAPSNPQDGQFWFDTTAGKMYVYYNDGSSAQWVSTLGGLVGQTGTEGQQLIHNGTEWVAYDGGSRNILYNGAMQVAQRGTSETGITGPGYFTADRWQLFASSLGTWTQTVEDDGPDGSGFTKSLKMECTTADASPAASDRILIQQNLEGFDAQGLKFGYSEAESLTLSFWVKSNVTGTYIVEFQTDSSREISQAYTVNSADTWEQKTITVAGDTVSTIANDNGIGLRAAFVLGGGSDFTSGSLNTSWNNTANANRYVGQTNLGASSGNYWQITGVQLETGTVATGFDHKPFGVELAECQRYFEKVTIGNEGSMGVGNVSGSNDVNRANLALAVPKRASASLVDIQNLQAYSANIVSDVITIGQVNNVFGGLSFLGFDCQPTSFAASAGQVVVFINTSGSSEGYISVDAEL